MTRYLLLAALILQVGVFSKSVTAEDASTSFKLESIELGTISNLHSFGATLLCGQPSASDLAKAKERGIEHVISLRELDEIDWNQAEAVEALGLQYYHFAFRSPESLTDEIFENSLKLLANSQMSPVMLHCASANRVGAIWLAHRVLNDGLQLAEARDEAKKVGLKTPAFEEKALAYIENQKARKTDVPEGINDRFLDANLDVSEWLGRFEIESREVYFAREKVLDACAIKPGDSVADIGAGTGFYSRLFASAVGETGWVYAVDISPRFLEHINRKSQSDKVTNITSVLCTDQSVRLPPNSVDVAFICDTYHHFESPQATMASIHRALKPGGTLVVIDFERIPGKSREFILGHVRAGKEVFQAEIVESGFQFIEELKIPAFKENYLLRFQKK
ncbi:methyltransferase domain-containing protein [Thalassoglobus polymorphus]|nr:methyltransferase domain-containing protein [Thalassoglobus polymorphus]